MTAMLTEDSDSPAEVTLDSLMAMRDGDALKQIEALMRSQDATHQQLVHTLADLPLSRIPEDFPPHRWHPIQFARRVIAQSV